ncbi:hypothetical protein U1Q18_023140 [Sarracenia purpurea var. burkii]
MVKARVEEWKEEEIDWRRASVKSIEEEEIDREGVWHPQLPLFVNNASLGATARAKIRWKRHDKDEHLQRSKKLKPKTVVVRTILSRLYDFPKPGVVSEPDDEEAEQPALIQKLGFRSLFSLLLCDGDFGG